MGDIESNSGGRSGEGREIVVTAEANEILEIRSVCAQGGGRLCLAYIVLGFFDKVFQIARGRDQGEFRNLHG